MSAGRAGPDSSWWRQVWRRERIPVLTTAAILLLAIAAVTLAGQRPDTPGWGTIGGSTPVSTALYIDPHMLSIAAAREDPRFDLIADTPQGKWFTDWSTSATARSDVGDYLAGAAAANEIPTMVLYRIPQRDCGAFARGGAPMSMSTRPGSTALRQR